MIENNDIINLLIKLANKAYKKGEIPVSAVLVKSQKVISKKYNLKEKTKDITAHAEILCIREAAKKLKSWNLSDYDLYVTLKPCNMCMEIIKQSRIKNVYYLLDKLDYKHEFTKTNFQKIESKNNIDTYQQLLSNFFQNMR